MDRVSPAPVILIADDDPDDRMMIQEAFEERCPYCRLYFAQDGEELMKFLYGERQGTDQSGTGLIPDLLLLDLNMPLKDGRESLVEIRAHPLSAAMPTVVMTTSESDEDRLFCQQNGANSYIVKPSRYMELLDVVESLKPYFTQTTDSLHKPDNYE